MSYEKVAAVRSKIVIGLKETLKAMKNDEISEVIIAEDADQFITSQVEQLAEVLDIQCLKVNSKKRLGAACGIDVATSTVAIRK
ncbi:ribosomal L7Ae/L30e/S12e/Gadd45 family protein [Virgibacillus sp. MSJ-26]|uniref:ribosomal L7Ae/L30e/S12e/Gadd45 family protein n=1 Tax=Virgibacillus sp. MSJ-26 TaxID=2841522 RepID=UPI001C1163A3|nr:ribosomal L7Ae/L30e/S12e/Gadd45 family protein [Virgibacillus sp. MSJ-26]MBU5467998.1 ribosomal L7Ae/L30e/S12e/Gadd45 family protein [Virgibacillus sp. MSJ-26]